MFLSQSEKISMVVRELAAQTAKMGRLMAEALEGLHASIIEIRVDIIILYTWCFILSIIVLVMIIRGRRRKWEPSKN